MQLVMGKYGCLTLCSSVLDPASEMDHKGVVEVCARASGTADKVCIFVVGKVRFVCRRQVQVKEHAVTLALLFDGVVLERYGMSQMALLCQRRSSIVMAILSSSWQLKWCLAES